MGHDTCWWCLKPESMNVVVANKKQYLLCDKCVIKLKPEVIQIVEEAVRKAKKKD
jgi:hypothetical protein